MSEEALDVSICLRPLTLLLLTTCAACATGADDPAFAPEDPALAQEIARQAAAHARLAELERAFDTPDAALDWKFVNALVRARDDVAPPAYGRAGMNGWPLLSEQERRDIGRRLRDALSIKRGAALARTAATATHFAPQSPDPVIRDAALRGWPDTDPEIRRYLLDAGWAVVQSEDFLPHLRAECDAIESRQQPVTPWHVADAPTMALLRLHELRPAEGRERILADIRTGAPRFGGRALVALSDERLAEVDAQFRRPIAELLHWSFDQEKLGALAERYGGPDSVRAAKAVLDSPGGSANASMLRVVMAHDRADGLRRLGAALRAPQNPRGMRRHGVLRQVLARNWIERKDLWGDDAAEFVGSLIADPAIDADTRAEAARLLEEREPR